MSYLIAEMVYMGLQMNYNICLIGILLCLFLLAEGQSQFHSIEVALYPGAKKQFDVPTLFKGYQKVYLDAFYNSDSNQTSTPCSFKRTLYTYFKRQGQLKRLRNSSAVGEDFWKGGDLWDVLEESNRLICVYQSGQVQYFSITPENDSHPIQKARSSRPLEGTIDYGKLVEYEQNGRYTLYVSRSGCYLVKEDGAWSVFAGFQNHPDLHWVKVYHRKLFVAAANILCIYSVDVGQLTIKKQYTVSLLLQKTGQLRVQKFEYDEVSNKIYLIDAREGVKYFMLNSSASSVVVRHLLAQQNCSDMKIQRGLLFVSCSNLAIVNASTSKVIYKQPFSFRVENIVMNDTFLHAFGQMYLAVFRVTGSRGDTAKVRFLYQTEVPVFTRYESFLYLGSIKKIVIVTKNSVSFGIITGEYSKISCSYRDALKEQQEGQLWGQNLGSLRIYGACDGADQSLLTQECSALVPIKVNVIDLHRYKRIVLIALGIALILVLFWEIIKIAQLKITRYKLKYKYLVEQTVSDVQSEKVDEIKEGAQIRAVRN